MAVTPKSSIISIWRRVFPVALGITVMPIFSAP
ncbi:MAG: hypothetical protein BWX50_00959 [Euryarchaeota archaeon ADurb.Bin009]|nr:MAG: hypothetical protein BWX50_00959 [Euryarchaeota archaeon ADurb.Bin009]